MTAGSPLLGVRGAVALVCLTVSVLTALGALQYSSVKGVALPVTGPFPFADVYHDAALSTGDPQMALGWAQKSRQSAPARALPEVLVAYALAKKDGRFSQPALEALQRSYDKMLYAPDTHDFRLGLIYANWGQMTPQLRRLANAEANQYARRYHGRLFLEQAVKKVRGPGYAALSLVLMRYRLEQQIARRDADALSQASGAVGGRQ